MPEFTFYINDEQRMKLVSSILGEKTIIIVDESYTTKDVNIIQSLEDYSLSMNKGESKFFLLNDKYTVEPIINSKNRFSEKPLYSIEQRKGGPYIDLFFYLGFSEDDTIRYKKSVIDHYSRFIHYDTYDEFVAPNGLKLFFQELVHLIKAMCKTIEKEGKKFWISEEVLYEIGGSEPPDSYRVVTCQ
jgi:hypothetical protein